MTGFKRVPQRNSVDSDSADEEPEHRLFSEWKESAQADPTQAIWSLTSNSSLKGAVLEAWVRSKLRDLLRESGLRVSTGVVVDSSDFQPRSLREAVSGTPNSQCDVIIWDPAHTPLIEVGDEFVAVESSRVLAIVEVKASLKLSSELWRQIRALASQARGGWEVERWLVVGAGSGGLNSDRRKSLNVNDPIFLRDQSGGLCPSHLKPIADAAIESTVVARSRDFQLRV